MSKDKTKLEVAKPTLIKIPLGFEVARIRKIDKDGKSSIVDSKLPNGDPNYIRNDAVGLQRLLGLFDTTEHQVREWKQWMSVKKKLYNCYLEDGKVLLLTTEEAVFLKGFLKDLPDALKKKKTPLQEFETRTWVGVSESLESM